jgi:chemotaxis protein CheD
MIAMGTVSMGQLAIASAPGEELVARGLGSCIGLALVDRVAGVAGLAHIVLPEAQDKESATAKFADRAVPALIAQMCSAGASELRLEAAIAGGAKMFEVSGDLDIGGRNEVAVRNELARRGLEVRAAATGGSRGRTMRVAAGDCAVTVKESGGGTITLLDANASNGFEQERG